MLKKKFGEKEFIKNNKQKHDLQHSLKHQN